MITRTKSEEKTPTKTQKTDTYEIEWYDVTSSEKRESAVITTEMFYIIYDTLMKTSYVKDIKVWAVMHGVKKLIEDPEKQVMQFMRDAVKNMLDKGYDATESTE